MDDAHRQSLIDLLVHDDPEHRQQGVVLLHSLGAEAASQLFAAPRVERDRPAVSITEGYLLSDEMLAAWTGPETTPWPWTTELIGLDLAGQFRLTQLGALAAAPQLEVLKLVSCVHLESLEGLGHLQKLAWLELSRCAGIESLAGLEGCAELEELHLTGCAKLSDITALTGCHALKLIDLRSCGEVTDISALAGLPHLTHVDLPSSVTDFTPLLDCPKLVRVHTGSLWGGREEAAACLRDHCEVVES
jgi:hypothetical protein